MSIATIIRQHRKRKEQTQQNLADELGVSLMTITRLESGRQETLSSTLIAKLNKVLDEEDYKQMDPNDPLEGKLLTYHAKMRSDIEERTIEYSSKSPSPKVFESLDSLLSTIHLRDYEEMYFERLQNIQKTDEDYDTCGDVEIWLDYPLPLSSNEKVYTDNCGSWLVATAFASFFDNDADVYHVFDHVRKTLPNLLYRYIGISSVHTEIKKIALCVPERIIGFVSSEMRILLKRIHELRCDFSVLGYYETPDGFAFSEMDIFFQGNGHGYFDLNNSYDLENFKKWKSALFRTQTDIEAAATTADNPQ